MKTRLGRTGWAALLTLFAFATVVMPILPSKAGALVSQASFTETVIEAGQAPWGKQLADLDGDGFLDAVEAGPYVGFYWYKYPTWTKFQITGQCGNTDDLQVADVNNDGAVDLIATEGMCWLENPRGSGGNVEGIWAHHIIDASVNPHDLQVGDVTGDGKVDIVGRGTGEFGPTYLYIQGATPTTWTKVNMTNAPIGQGTALADIDLDGKVDIVGNGYWLKQPNNPTVSADWVRHNFVTWTQGASTVATDINNDGRTDIFIAPSEAGEGTVAWFENPADPVNGTWTRHNIGTVNDVHRFHVVDMNNDGARDVVFAEMHQSPSHRVGVFYNEGNNTTWTLQVLSTQGSHNIAVGDITNDGDNDILGANWHEDATDGAALKVWQNNTDQPPVQGLDNWTYIQADNTRDAAYFGLAMTDATGDGRKDIASGKYFYKNPGGNMAGAWTRSEFITGTTVDALLQVDVDGDAFADLIAMDGSGNVYWLEAADAGANSWNAVIVGTTESADHSISSQGYIAGQIHSGGKQEIVLNVGEIYYFTVPTSNPEAGNWGRTRIGSSISEGVALGDIDRDGDLDAVSADDYNHVSWWENPGTGAANWTKRAIGSVPSETADRIEIADFNGDSRLDVAVAVANGSTNGAYLFAAPADPTTGTWTRTTIVEQDTTNSMDAADMDGDGDVDILTGEHRGSQTLAIWENNGLGSFTEHVVDTGRESHLGAQVADLDGDGDLDIASIAWDSSEFLHIWRNDSVVGNPNDTTPPVITNVTAASAGDTSATITWTTNEPADTQVEYGLTTAYGSTTALNASRVITHTQNITGLTPSTTYHYRVLSKDAANNQTVSADFTFTTSTPDNTAPVISNVASSNITASTATITWGTDEPADRQVEYGTTTAYGNTTPLNTTLAANHSVSLNGLAMETTYHYRVVSKDASGNATISDDFTFTTTVLPSSLEAQWLFDETSGTTAVDSSGNGHTGMLQQGTSFAAGYKGNAANLDGNDDYVNIQPFDVGGQALTISAWVKPESFIGGHHDNRIISKATGTSEQDHYWMLTTIKKSDAETVLRFRLKTNGTTTTLIATTGNIPLNQWSHVVARYDGSTMKLFLNGAEVGSTNKTGSVSTNANVGVNIGRNPDGYGQWDGMIDDTRVYSQALSTGEIQDLFVGITDTTAPVISNVSSGGTTHNTATITWTTDEAADSQVEYGTSTSYGSSSTINTAKTTTHSVGLSGLSAETLYHYRVISRDAAGNVTVSNDFTFSTPVAPDTTAPVISGIASSGLTQTAATVSWTTNELSSTRVEYGTTTAYGSSSLLNTAPVTSHSVSLGGLNANTIYHYRVISVDAAGNVATSPDQTFTTLAVPDTTSPVIQSVASGSIQHTSAAITWGTNEAATSQVEYGTTTAYGSTTTLDTALVTAHTTNLTGLSPETVYHYRVISTDAAGNSTTSNDFTFSTVAVPDTTAPVISNIASSNTTETTTTISWTTDEAATSRVEYGTGTNYGNMTPVTSTHTTTHSVLVSGLTAGTTYHYRVLSADAAGNVTTSTDATFTTPDTTAPQITNIASSNITISAARVTWSTNEPANTQVEYGTDTNYGSTTTIDPSLVTAHTVNLAGLSNGVTYHYRVLSRDAAGNLSVSSDRTFTTTAISLTAGAGSDQSVPLNQAASLTGTVSYNGPGALTTTWTKDSGPGTVNFSSASSLTSQVTASAAGTYVLRITISDGTRTSTDTVTVTFTAVTTDPNLLARWLFDEISGTVAADSSGNGRNATLLQGASFAAGKTNNAVTFDGTNDYVNVQPFDVAGQALTLAAWVNPSQFSAPYNDNRIISKATNSSEGGHYWMLSTFKKSDTETVLRFRLKTNGTTTTLIASTGNIPLNQWSHVAATYDGTTMRLYVNGVLVGSTAKTGNLSTSATTAINIGRNPDNYGHWAGKIDDVRIYNRALTAVELQQL